MHRMMKDVALTAIVLVAGTWTVTRGQVFTPGSLDPTFGAGGMASTTVPQTYLAKWVATQNVQLSDGSWEEMLIAVGLDWTVARHRANGAIQPSPVAADGRAGRRQRPAFTFAFTSSSQLWMTLMWVTGGEDWNSLCTARKDSPSGATSNPRVGRQAQTVVRGVPSTFTSRVSNSG